MKKKLAVFLNAWSNEFDTKVLEGIRRRAKRDGIDVFVFSTYIFIDDDTLQNVCQLNIFQLPKPEDYDGAILFTNTFNLPEEQERILELWNSHNVPMISLEVKIPGIPYIGTDNYKGVRDLTKHLIEKHGCKKIIYVGGIKDNQENITRLKALTDTLEEHGLELEDTLFGDYGFFTAVDLADDWINSNRELPDAFVCANDYTAIGFCDILMENNIKVPEDVIVTGFDCCSELKNTFPMLASVSRGWDKLGEHAYDKLFYLIEHPDEDIDEVYDSQFVPCESCGCDAGHENETIRSQMIRSIYPNSTKNLSLDMHFQDLRIALSKLERKEDFYDAVKSCMEKNCYPGSDFYLCIEPGFFEIDDTSYPSSIKGYSYKMDVLLEMKDSKPLPSYTFDRTNIVPGYEQKEGESNTYLFLPFNHMDCVIGYLVLKNDLSMFYNQTLRRWLINMNTTFIQARQYVISQRANKKLRDVYMTDFLTNMYNRTGCEEVLYRFVDIEMKAGRKTIILFADINFMKVINDNYGHLNGDLAIKATSDALKHCLGNDWLFGRYGGDEFVAVGRYIQDQNMDKFREDLTERMNNFFSELNINFPLSASVGYTVISPDELGSIDDFIKRADVSMYEQKLIAHGENESN